MNHNLWLISYDKAAIARFITDIYKGCYVFRENYFGIKFETRQIFFIVGLVS